MNVFDFLVLYREEQKKLNKIFFYVSSFVFLLICVIWMIVFIIFNKNIQEKVIEQDQIIQNHVINYKNNYIRSLNKEKINTEFIEPLVKEKNFLLFINKNIRKNMYIEKINIKEKKFLIFGISNTWHDFDLFLNSAKKNHLIFDIAEYFNDLHFYIKLHYE